ncbi:MAG: hypothetical protein PVH68_14265, partial [Armatimonadota bacterium]
YSHSEYRWPAMRKRGGEGTLTVTVPKAGRFHPGAIVYDGSGRESYEMTIDGEALGRFVARADSKRQRLFFASRPVELRGGETIAVRAANTPASYVVEDIVLLAERPPMLQPTCQIRNLEVGYDREVGRMRATWTTTWPAICALEYGSGEIVEEEPAQNHRVHLPGLERGKTYECFVRADALDGPEVRSETVRFAAAAPEAPRGAVARERVELSVLTSGRGCPAGYPLTAGVPFPEGALGSADNMRLLGVGGGEVPAQASPLLFWPDGSVKVALVDAVAPEGSGDDAPLTLEYGRDVQRRAVEQFVRVSGRGNALAVTTPSLRVDFRRNESGLFARVWVDSAGQFGDETLITRDDAPARIVIVDDEGNEYDTLGPPDRVEVEEAGPLRAVVLLAGHHTGDAGGYFTYQVRMTFHAALPWVRMAYRWGNDRGEAEFTKFRGMRLELPLALAEGASFIVGAEQAARGSLSDGGARLEQMRDDSYTVVSEGGESKGRRAPGWAQAGDGRRAVALVSRCFWQLYPQAIGAGDGMLRLDICPEFGEKFYNDCSELDLIKLYYYLQDGRYKVRQGVTKLHEVMLLFGPTGDGWEPEELNALTDLINEPPVLAASPEWYAASEAFGSFVPETAGRTARYDEVCERTYNSYLGGRDRRREFGMLNFGDQWGERKVNWDNGEYDHHHTAAQMFLRSAGPKWYCLMETTARHDIDVDLCHYHTNPGYVGGSWIHAMGHTGKYFTQRYQGEWGIPGGGMSVSHTWCEGTCEYYALTGDPTAIEAARMIADHYGGTYLNNYDFTNGRVPGWHLLLTIAVYRATYDPFYLNAARIIVDRTLERRTPGSGWARQMVPGHCHCEPRCRGTCSFMQGILGCGLREYYLETGDERVREAVVDSARYVIDEMWVDEESAFRYTSCPESSVTASRNDTLAGLLLFAHELSGDQELLEVVKQGMDAGFERLSSMQHLRWTPYMVHALDGLEWEGLRRAGQE